jgi:hypothetical protein
MAQGLSSHPNAPCASPTQRTDTPVPDGLPSPARNRRETGPATSADFARPIGFALAEASRSPMTLAHVAARAVSALRAGRPSPRTRSLGCLVTNSSDEGSGQASTASAAPLSRRHTTLVRCIASKRPKPAAIRGHARVSCARARESTSSGRRPFGRGSRRRPSDTIPRAGSPRPSASDRRRLNE